VQAYVGDKLGYDEEPIKNNITIAVTDAGAIDGADIISEVGMVHVPAVARPCHGIEHAQRWPPFVILEASHLQIAHAFLQCN